MQDFLLSNEAYKDNIAHLKAELEKQGYDEAVINEAELTKVCGGWDEEKYGKTRYYQVQFPGTAGILLS